MAPAERFFIYLVLMKKSILLFSFALGLAIAGTAQTFCTSFGSSGAERAYSVKQTYDHGYVLCGVAANDVYVMKMDSALNMQWEKKYGGASIDVGYSIVQTFDSGYAVAGYATSLVSGMNRDVYVIRLDQQGNLLWTRTVGGVQNDGAFSIVQTTDSGFVVGGYTGNFGPNPVNNYLVKLTKTGTVQWQSTVGGMHQDYGYAAIQTADGGYAMAGSWAPNTLGMDMYISRFNATGTLAWTRTIGDHYNAPDVAYSIVQMPDGGFAMAGFTQSWGAGANDLYIVRLDPGGNMIWSRTIGGTGAECTTAVSLTDPRPVSMQRTSDGGFVLASSTRSFGVLGGTDVYVVKLDSAGTLQWTRTIGGAGAEEAYSIIQNDEGGYALVGRSTSFGLGSDDIFFAVLDSTGNDCCVSGSGGIVGTGSIVGFNGTYGVGGTAGSGGTASAISLSRISGCLVCTPPTITIPPPAPTCLGDSAIITPVVTGGIGPYNYSWAPGGYTTASITVSPSANTTYTLTVRDSVYCRATLTVTLVMNPLPNISVSGFSVICNGQANVISATGTPNYQWQPGNYTTPSVTVTPTVSTTYTIIGTDANGCQDIDTFPVTVNNCPDLAQFCFTVNNGGTEYGFGAAQFTDGNYLLAGSTNMASSSHDIYLTKLAKNGYIMWTRRLATATDDLPYAMIKTADSGFAMTGVANNKLMVMKLDSTGTMVWSRNVGIGVYPSQGNEIRQTSDGGYIVVGTTQDGGSFVDDQVYIVKLSSTGTLQWTKVVGNPAANERGYCVVQTSDGGYAVGGEVGGYISGWQNNYVIRLNSAGTVLWTSIFGTTSDDQIEGIAELPNGDLLLAGYSTILTGPLLARMNPSGTVIWAKEILGMATHRSRRLIPTANGGFALLTSAGEIVKLDSALNIEWATAPSSGSVEGTACTLASDGSFLLSGFMSNNNVFISKSDASGLGCCSQYVTASYANVTWITGTGATITSGGTLTTPTFTSAASGGLLTQLCSAPLTAPSVNLGPDTTVCASLILQANSAGASYLWSTGQTTSFITVTSSGTYWVQASNSVGSDADTIQVIVNPPPALTTSGNAAICAGDTATLSVVSAGSTFAWLPSGSLDNATASTVNAFPSATTTYSVTATDANGCTSASTLTVTVNPLPVANAGTDRSVCSGTPTTLGSASSGTCSWTPSAGLNSPTACQPIATPSSNTLYVLTVTSAAGCVDTDTVMVTVLALPTADAGSDAAICPGGQATLNGTGGISCNWSPSAGLNAANICQPVASPSLTTDYILTVTDANGCTDQDSVNVTVYPAPALSSCCGQSICMGDTVQLTATSPFSNFSWSPATGLSATSGSSVQAFPSTTTNYSVTVTDTAGCSQTSTMFITVNALPMANAGADLSVCAGNAVSLNGSGGVTCNWQPSAGLNNPALCQPVATPLVSTAYELTVTDVNGCSATDSILITVNPLPIAQAGPDQITCAGVPVTLNGSGGVTCAWTPAAGLSATNVYQPVATVSVTTDYVITVTDVNGCQANDTTRVNIHQPVSATATVINVSCFGGSDGSATVNASGGTLPYAYLWSSGGTGVTESGLTAGSHSVTVTDASGCVLTVAVAVTEPTALLVSVSNIGSPATCGGSDGTIDISASGGTVSYQFLWSNGATTEDLIGITAGSYSVIVTDANGCTATTVATVNDPGIPTVTLALPVDTVCGSIPGTITLTGGSPFGGTWGGNHVSGNTFDPYNAGAGVHFITYSYTDTNACTASVTDSLVVDLCMGIEPLSTATWTIYPNPTSGEITLTTTGSLSGEFVIEIFTIEGALIQSKTTREADSIIVDFTPQPAGIYFIRIASNGHVNVMRVVKM